MADIEFVSGGDIDAWLALAREVEPLFGPMAGEEAFINALRETIADRRAYCIRSDEGLAGVIALAGGGNEIAWFAVDEQARGRGCGRRLLAFVLEECDPALPVTVQTFDGACPAGAAARHLYESAGFVEAEKAGPNPAGVPTVIMRRRPARG